MMGSSHFHNSLFVLLVVSMATFTLVQSECRVPPQFWCDDPQISAACGVLDQCRTLNDSTSNNPVTFALYYESLCPDCKNLFEYQLSAAYQKVGTIMDVQLVPYGNAREYYDYGTGQWVFYCQHGPEECTGNLIETCAINMYKNVSVHFPFISCMEMSSYRRPKDAAMECARQYPQLDIQAILSCVTSPKGNSLEHQMAAKTQALWPRHQYVPWVTVNGAHTQRIQNMAMTDLVRLICVTYTGSPKPAACYQKT